MKTIPIHPIKTYAASKMQRVNEVQVVFFETCNLSCSFCHQDHNAALTYKDILPIADTIINTATPDKENVICVSGGELFMDTIPDEYFDKYFDFALKVHESVEWYRLNFVTNLVYESIDRVVSFQDRLKAAGINAHFFASYDPCGRFNKKDKSKFFENLKTLGPRIESVSMVITKQNAKWFLDGKHCEVFDYIYEHYHFFMDYFTPRGGYDHVEPTTREIVDLFKLVNNKYPKVDPVREWREHEVNQATCRSANLVCGIGATKCRAHIGEMTSCNYEKDHEAWLSLSSKFIDKYNCLMCKHWRRCGLRCFKTVNYDDGDGNCLYVELFDELTKGQ